MEGQITKAYFNGLQRNIRCMIQRFVSEKESLDDSAIKTLEDMIGVYKTAGFEYAKDWSRERQLFFEKRVDTVACQKAESIGYLADD